MVEITPFLIKGKASLKMMKIYHTLALDYRIDANLLDFLQTSRDETSSSGNHSQIFTSSPKSSGEKSPNLILGVEKFAPPFTSPLLSFAVANDGIIPSYAKSNSIPKKAVNSRPGPAMTPPPLLPPVLRSEPENSNPVPTTLGSSALSPAKVLVQSHFGTIPSPAKISRNDDQPVPSALVYLPGGGTRPWNPDAAKEAPVAAEKIGPKVQTPLICGKCAQEVCPQDQKSLKKHVDGHLNETNFYQCARCPSLLKTRKSMERHLSGPHKIELITAEKFLTSGINVKGIDYFDVRGEIFSKLWNECFPNNLNW